MTLQHKVASASLATIAFLSCLLSTHAVSNQPADDSSLSSAICPIAYPVDQSPSTRGYEYIFFGNAFFINKQGYLLTAAHVLSAFRNGGGQPHILVDRPMAPPQLLPAELVAVDWEHDVAILRATPNPFESKYKVTFLPLTATRPLPGTSVLAVALRPSKLRSPHTFEMPVHDRLSGEVLNYQFTQEEKGAGDTELFLFSHEVLRGQSGAPVLSAETQEVVGFVEGRWLHAAAVPAGTAEEQLIPTQGAAVRIHYAIALLQEKGIAWQSSSGTSSQTQTPADPVKDCPLPTPLSLVAAPYPPQSLSGSEILLDALVNISGRLVDIKVVKGDAPFLEKALSAVRTWTFLPALTGGHPVEVRIGIAFQFPQMYPSTAARRAHNYEEPLAKSAERGALPVVTVEPQNLSNNGAEASVILFDRIDRQGEVTSTQIFQDLPPLTPLAVTAARQWRFVPGKHAAAATDSAAVVVFTFRHAGVADHTPPAKQSR
jgi:hypothetical protein